MKRSWNETTAVKFLKDESKTTVNGKIIGVGSEGVGGLTSCSAFDFLIGYCGYRRGTNRR